MKLPAQIRLNIGKLFLIVIAYMLISLFIVAFSYIMLTGPFSLGPSDLFNLRNQLIVNLISAAVAGVLGGTSLLIANGSLFRRRPFRFALLFTAVSYVVLFVMVVIINVVFTARFNTDSNASFEAMFRTFFEMVSDFNLMIYFVLWGTITLGTLFLLQVNDKFGPGILIKFLRGQYHSPKDEQRIFMFLDMRSSTRIAEKIGHHAYFNLLRDLFADITNIILAHEGEIYQYVGDEVVISWKLEKGLKNANCVKCFTGIEQKLKDNEGEYFGKYGVEPEFKAGLHFGQVTAGEVGVIKKDIVYTGDVLNTAARIQGQCNHHNVNLLLSDELFHLLDHKDEYELISIGSIELRGKEEKVALSTLRVA